jgi:hypothetical protein
LLRRSEAASASRRRERGARRRKAGIQGKNSWIPAGACPRAGGDGNERMVMRSEMNQQAQPGYPVARTERSEIRGEPFPASIPSPDIAGAQSGLQFPNDHFGNERLLWRRYRVGQSDQRAHAQCATRLVSPPAQCRAHATPAHLSKVAGYFKFLSHISRILAQLSSEAVAS